MVILYITAPTKYEAKKISQALLKKHLVACTNCIDGVESQYRWKSKIKSTKEVIIIAKTQKKLVSRVIKEIKKIHSYEIPCVVGMTVKYGNTDFLNWVKSEL